MNEVLTAKEIGRLFRVSAKTVQRWSKIGKLPKAVVPGRWLRRDILDILDKRDTHQE
jgi:hypothetical protein